MDLPMNLELPWLESQPVTVEEYREEIEKRLKRYDYVITEDNRKEAEEDKKQISDTFKVIEKNRKDSFSKIKALEKQLISIEHLMENKAKEMGKQISELDQHFIDEKRNEIIEYYNSKNFDLVLLDKIFDKKWLNKTCKDWKEQIDNKIEAIKQELELINNFGVSDEEKEEIKGYYLDCLNIMEARNQFDAQKSRREQIKKLQENKQLAQEQKQAPQPQEQAHSVPLQEEAPKQVQQVKKTRWVVEFVGTDVFKDKMNSVLRECQKSNDVEVKILKKEDVE